ncbi:hypothetical protein [Methylobacterium thuringiense]|uniref:Uncharacterized protein n=1 Tax=Methylobacterium thuringiense TaxID=1003091 RepID=A0ABQ4TIM3_9HYPH|nr:hypothetical protein [Methylobacterium thuringiense]GJE53902.1 hypothetical protein EKPJFOCH_0370 [Methylobacterium thuringiense]
MNPFQAIKKAYAALCGSLSDTSDRLGRQNADRLKRLDAYNARYGKTTPKNGTGSDRH